MSPSEALAAKSIEDLPPGPEVLGDPPMSGGAAPAQNCGRLADNLVKSGVIVMEHLLGYEPSQ